jgi:hypothetical protein
MNRLATGRLLSFVAGLSLIATLAGGGSALGSTHRRSISSPNLSASERQQTTLRRNFGLASDLASVRSTKNTVAGKNSALGIPLTENEQSNIQSRDRVLPVIQRARSVLEADAKFAGLYIDQRAGGTLVIMMTNASLTPTELAAVGPTSVYGPKIRRATYSLAHLTDELAYVGKAQVDQRGAARYIQSSSIDIPANTVVLSVDPNAPRSAEDELRQLYKNRRGLTITRSTIVMSYKTTNRDLKSGLAYGGEYISRDSATPGVYAGCSMGFANYTNSANQHYSLTAGHCGNGTWRQGLNASGNVLGGTHNNEFTGRSSGHCECVAVGPIPQNVATRGILGTGNAVIGMTHIGYGNSLYETAVGQRVCLSGGTSADHGSDLNCGAITSNRGDTTVEGWTLVDALTTNNTSFSGDSGGPLENATYHGLLGFLSSGGPYGLSTFSKSLYASELGINFN